MQLAEPLWIGIAVVALGAIIALAWLDARRRRRAVERFASPALAEALTGAVARRRRRLKVVLVALGAAAATAALARPQWGWRWEDTERQGTDILFAIDTSNSMLAADVRPSRLERAKLAVADLVEQFDGDRAGLVAFAGEAFLQSPMTMDRGAFERSLHELDTEIIPRGGTDVGAAIRESIAAFGESQHEKILVLLTDGESLEGDAVRAAEEAAEAGVRIFTVGLGSSAGTPIPVPDEHGNETLLRDPGTGEVVRSRLDEASLRRIADVTGGAYEPLGQDGHGLTRLWRDHLSALPSHAVASRRHRVFTERFQWPLGLGLALLLVEPLIGERRRRKRASRQRAGATPTAAAFAALVAVTTVPAIALASPHDAQEAYRRGDFERAHRAFADAAERESDPTLHFNAGAAAYRAGDHEAAVEAMDRALRSGDVELQPGAYYDRGNAQYRIGESTLPSDREATKTAWKAAVASYESALALRPGDADAQYNLDLVRRRLALLEQAQQEQAQQDPQRQQGEGSQPQDAAGQQGEGSQSRDQPGIQTEHDPGGAPMAAETVGAPAGRLSREQAEQLLRSLRDDERRFPLTGRRGEPGPSSAETLRDW